MENENFRILLEMNRCNKCGQQRLAFCYHMLPDNIKVAFATFGERAEYLYCENCKEFTASGEWEPFGN